MCATTCEFEETLVLREIGIHGHRPGTVRLKHLLHKHDTYMEN